jgi:hypothetical protein
VLLGIMDSLNPAEIPLSILVQEIVEFDEVAALDEILLETQVVELNGFRIPFQLVVKILGLFVDVIANIREPRFSNYVLVS